MEAVADAGGFVFVGDAADEAAESVGPVGVGEEGAQDGAAEELAAGSDLWGDGVFAEPAFDRAVHCGVVAVGVVESSFEGERDVVVEEDLGPCAEGLPVVVAVSSVAVAQSFER